MTDDRPPRLRLDDAIGPDGPLAKIWLRVSGLLHAREILEESSPLNELTFEARHLRGRALQLLEEQLAEAMADLETLAGRMTAPNDADRPRPGAGPGAA